MNHPHRSHQLSHQEHGQRQRHDFWHTVLSNELETQQHHKPSIQLAPLSMSHSHAHLSLSPTTHSSSPSSSHLSTSSSSMKKDSPCPMCNSHFKRRYDLIQHISAVHEKNRPYSCPLCDHSFAHKGTLSKHIRTVHRRERPYVCEHCGQRFSERGNVNKHKQRSAPCRLAELNLKKSATSAATPPTAPLHQHHRS